ncbi:MAG: PKD domain-containing protein [Phycisphaerales bacterium]
MQNTKNGRSKLATIGALVALSGAAASALAQLGSFPVSDLAGQGMLPFQLELAISEKAPSTMSASLMRSAVVRAMHSTKMCYASNLTNEQWQNLLTTFQFLPPSQTPADPNDPFGDRFNVDTYRWGPAGTASSSFPSGVAIATNLTVSFPNDGPTWGNAGSGFAVAANGLGASLTSQFGNLEKGREYLRQCLGSWRRYGGITYTEVADDNTTMTNSAAHNAARGDIRLGGISLNGQSGVLAYNCFPSPGGLGGSLTGGDMTINTAYFGDASTFNGTANNYRYFRNVCTHEHGHGLGFIHQIPCTSTKLMEPFIQTVTEGLPVDDRRAVNRNYGDRFSGNQSLATAKDFGELGSPARSISSQSLSLNGYWNNGANASGADYFKFTLSTTQNVVIKVTPMGNTYSTGPQASGCTGTATAYATNNNADLAYVLTNSDGSVTIGAVNATAPGAAETFTFSNLAAGSYALQVYDNNAANPTNGADANTILQLYNLEIQVGTNVYADPYANAGINKRIQAGLAAQFIGDINSGITETRIAETISRYEWDLDGDGVFETGVAPAASVPKPTMTYVSNGTYPVTLRVRDSQGKTGTDTINVVVFGGVTTFTNTPVNGVQGTIVPFTIVGTNLKNVTSASQVTLTSGTGVTVTGTPVPNSMGTQVTGLSFVIDIAASVGGHNTRVGNIDGNATYTDFLTVTAAAAPCPGDLNGDGFVDDSDFVLFAAAYDLLDCADPSMPAGCPADLNDDGIVDDTDFVMFSSAYDAFLCP